MSRLGMLRVLLLTTLIVIIRCQNGGTDDQRSSTSEKVKTSSFNRDAVKGLNSKSKVVSLVKSDDEDDINWSGEGESGSGSGDVDIRTDSLDSFTTAVPSTDAGSGEIDATTATTNERTDSVPTTDHEVINPTTGDTIATTDLGNNVEEPVVITADNNVVTDNNADVFGNDINSAGRQVTGRNDDDGGDGLSFTVGIIAGVVIGALLAVLVILFLVYRLRKKDAGSYILEDNSGGYKPVPGSPGGDKEYYT